MKGDLKKLQGAWDIVALEIEGRKMAEGAFKGSLIVVRGDTFESLSMGATYKGRVEVDDAKTPRRMDMLFEEGPEEGNRSFGIYELDGDTWRICLTLFGKNRPTAFATKAGSGLALETLKRHTGAVAQDPLREQIALLEGEWSMVSCEKDGELLPRGFSATGRRLAKGNETTVMFGTQVFLKAAYSLGTANRPRTIDYILTDGPNRGEYQYGIYELEKDRVTFCFAPPGRPRPVEFTTRTAEGVTLAVWKRVPPS